MLQSLYTLAPSYGYAGGSGGPMWMLLEPPGVTPRVAAMVGGLSDFVESRKLIGHFAQTST